MRQDKKLSLLMAILFLFIIVSFGIIIVNEKKYVINLPKIDKKLNNYLKKKYSNLDITSDKTIYEDGTYKMKVTSTQNKDLYFFIKYKNKNITSTYNRDYLEGKTLLNKISKDLKIDISKKVNYKIRVSINNSLDNYSNKIKKRIINEDNIIMLKIYDIYIDLEVNEFNDENIYNKIIKVEDTFSKNDITPKTYNFIITNKNDITESVEINNISSNIEKNDLKVIISDIMNKNKSDILNKYNITYKYLN